jgi:hypothetical protein
MATFRTDPLTDDGKVDMDFFNSHEYKSEQQSLISYLYAEGFDMKNEDFVIDYRSRRWHIMLEKNKKKK